MALLFAAMSVSAVTLTNSTGNITWDYNNTASFSGSKKWTDNNDAFYNGGQGVINVDNTYGQVGAYRITFNPPYTCNFTNGLLQIGAGGIFDSLTGGGGNPKFYNNLQLMADQVWSKNNRNQDLQMYGNLSGTANLIFDALNYNGRLSLYGSNSLSGTMTVQNAGRLLLDYKVMGQNNSKLDPNSSLILSNSADIQWQGGYNFTQAVNGLTISGPGYFYLNRVNSNNVLQVGAITRIGVGSTLIFGNPSGAVTTSSTNQNGILGAWATTANTANTTNGWAYNATGTANGPLGTFLGTSDTNSAGWTATENVSMTNGALVTLDGSKPINTLRLAGTTNFNLGGNTLTLAAGGLMATAKNSTMSNGYIQSGLASGELFVYANGVNLTNSAIIQDNGATPTILVKAGGGTNIVAGLNTYSGATYVNQGALLVANGANLSTNVINVSYNGTLTFNRTDTLSLSNTFTSYGIVQNIGSGTLSLTTSNSIFGLPFTSGFTQPVLQNTGSGTLNVNLIGPNTLGNIANSGSGTLSLTGAGLVNTGVQFTVSNGGIILTNVSMVMTAVGGQTVIGSSTISVGNYLLIAGTNGPNSQTTLNNSGGPIFIGSGGAGCYNNTVMISEGGVLTNSAITLGGGTTASGPNNALIVTNGGQVFARLDKGITGSITALQLGYYAGANSNYVYVGGTDISGNNALLDLGGSALTLGGYSTGYLIGPGNGNWVKVDQGGVVTNGSSIGVGCLSTSSGNYLIVTNGGKVFTSGNSYIGDHGTTSVGNTNGMYNWAQVTGNGSLWSVGGTMAVGNGTNNCNFNSLLVDNGGMVTNITTLNVGVAGGGGNNNSNFVSVTGGGLLEIKTGISIANNTGATSSGNTVTNNGGILQFTTATPAISIKNSTQNGIVITDATISYKGLLVAGRVNLTNNWGNSGIGTNGVVWSGANTLRLHSSAATNSLGWPYIFDTFNPVAPTNYVNLELLGNSAIYGKGVIIGANGSMRLSDAVATISGGVTNFGRIAGSGTISSLVTMAAGSSLSPDGTGTLAFSTNLTFTGTSTYNWNYNASTCSVVSVGGTLTLPATMNLTVNGIGDLPANTVFFTWPTGTTAPSTTWTVSPEKYAVRATPTGYVLTIRAGTVITIY
jgi:autotransporter-associated beta strand protein